MTASSELSGTGTRLARGLASRPARLHAKVGLCPAIWQRFTRGLQIRVGAREIAHLPVGNCQHCTSERMLWIAIERFVGPHDHVIVPTLIPEREGDLHVSERRRRVAFQTL